MTRALFLIPLLASLGLVACDRPATPVAPVVVTPSAGPAGPAGPTGNTGKTGGGNTTVIVVPPASYAPQN